MPAKRYDAMPIEVALWIAERAVRGRMPSAQALCERFRGMSEPTAFRWRQKARVHFEQLRARGEQP